jgi:hypothetical protein
VAKNQSGKYKKEKERRLLIIHKLDLKEETNPLSTNEKL